MSVERSKEPMGCMSAGICQKPERTYGEPHYCGKPFGHRGAHICRRCGMEIWTDPGSLIVLTKPFRMVSHSTNPGYTKRLPFWQRPIRAAMNWWRRANEQ
jgi:hypothetical protein